MIELWYGIVAVMLTAYVILDGFDLGAGAIHLLVARTNDERRRVLAAIGPYWDANEVWLLATGGALFVAFPAVLAAGLSGFYFAIFLVLWCLILRGIAIEFRSHLGDGQWRAFWDATFAIASALLAVFFGAALGNLLRGLPLTEDGWFGLTLFTDFSARPPVGILDWYTIGAGLFALLALAQHGALYLAWKTDGDVQDRAARISRRLDLVLAFLWPLMTVATVMVNRPMFAQFMHRPLAWLGIGLALTGRGFSRGIAVPGRYRAAFLGSCAFLAGLMVATAASVFPVMLRAVPDASRSITAFNGSNDHAGLVTAFHWWLVGFPIAIAWFILLFRLHRGRAETPREGEGY